MAKNTELSVYELGIIKNSLRDRMVNIEDFRTDTTVSDDDIDTFSTELMNIKEKIRVMIENKLEDNFL